MNSCMCQTNTNSEAHFCRSYYSSYPMVLKNHCLDMLHVLFAPGFGLLSHPLCLNNTGSPTFKHFSPLAYTPLLRTVVFMLDSQLSVDLCPFHKRHTTTCCLVHTHLVEQPFLCDIYLVCTESPLYLYYVQLSFFCPYCFCFVSYLHSTD